jgi:glycosyltransferase involved in cell wall biosynthesis
MIVTLFGHGPNEKTLLRLKQLYGLDNVRLGGFTRDVCSVWEQHHALILPSRYEGLPIVVVEAMLCGRPCIVTDVMGSAELLEHGVTGFVAEAPTTYHIDKALEDAWEARSRWAEIGRQAAIAVRKEVPADPIGVFAAEVRRWAEGKGTYDTD